MAVSVVTFYDAGNPCDRFYRVFLHLTYPPNRIRPSAVAGLMLALEEMTQMRQKGMRHEAMYLIAVGVHGLVLTQQHTKVDHPDQETFLQRGT